MAIEMYRIDDRLIHGQVVVGWGQPLDLQFIVLVDEEVAASDWEQELYRMGVPPEMEVYFESVASAAAQLPKYQDNRVPACCSRANIETMARLVEATGSIQAVNLGGIHHKAGRVQRLRYVFLSPAEEGALRALARKGVAVNAQDVPAARPLTLDEVLGGEGEPMNLVETGALSMLGAVLGLDVVSFPQAMLSRPLVAATLTGALMGAPERGLLLGATLECFALETLPVGASRYPEWGSSSVVGGALVSLPASTGAGALLLAVILTLSWAWVGGWSMVQLRRLNAHWARARHEAVARGSRTSVIGLQLYGMTADLVRGGAMTLLGLLLFVPVHQAAAARWSLPEVTTRGVLMALAGIVAAGATHKVFHAISGTRWYMLAGLTIGALLLGSTR